MKKKEDEILLSKRIKVMLSLTLILLLLTFIYIGYESYKNNNYLFFIIYNIFVIFIIYFSYKEIYIPYKDINKVLQLFYQGYIFKGIFDMRSFFNKDMKLTFKAFKEIIDTKELIEGSRKHAEYLALQNQINPHFLYNTLEGIRSEAIIEDVDSIANMTEALAIYFRYTISNVDKFVTLEDEINNIKNYYKIQEFRFGDKLDLKIEFNTDNEKEVLNAKVPKLTLQPFFENAIFHGIERKMGKGIITLKISSTKERLIIVISDNGVGMSDEKVRTINEKLSGASIEHMKEEKKDGGIALLNVNSRIKLIFGDEYGVYIYSKLDSGTDVEITMPYVLDEEKIWKKKY